MNLGNPQAGSAPNQVAGPVGRRFDRRSPLDNSGVNNVATSPDARRLNAQLAAQSAVSSWTNPTRRDYSEARWFAGRYADNPQYRQNQSFFENRERWRENFLRSVAVNAFVTNAGYYDGYSPVYQSYFYQAPYDPGFGTIYYDPGAYDYVYPGYATTAAYYSDPAFEISYDPDYGASVIFSDVYEDDFPYVEFTDPYAGDYFRREDLGQLVAYGYEQGYYDGLAARNSGYEVEYFDDPYAYDNTIYDPYSYSLGQNRKCLGKGYELGYVDALYGREEYDPAYYGDVNIVAAFVGEVSIMLQVSI